MARFNEGDEVILRATVTRAVDDDQVSVVVKGYGQTRLTLREDFVEKATATAKKRGMEGVLTRQ